LSKAVIRAVSSKKSLSYSPCKTTQITVKNIKANKCKCCLTTETSLMRYAEDNSREYRNLNGDTATAFTLPLPSVVSAPVQMAINIDSTSNSAKNLKTTSKYFQQPRSSGIDETIRLHIVHKIPFLC